MLLSQLRAIKFTYLFYLNMFSSLRSWLTWFPSLYWHLEFKHFTNSMSLNFTLYYQFIKMADLRYFLLWFVSKANYINHLLKLHFGSNFWKVFGWIQLFHIFYINVDLFFFQLIPLLTSLMGAKSNKSFHNLRSIDWEMKRCVV